MSSAERMRTICKWKAYLDEWIALRQKMVELDDAISEEFEDNGIISFDNLTYSKMDDMHKELRIKDVPKFMLYRHGWEIADVLDLFVYEYKIKSPNFNKCKFFIYRDFEFFWYE